MKTLRVAGISLAGDSEGREWSGVQILADGTNSSVKLTNKDGRQELIHAEVIEPRIRQRTEFLCHRFNKPRTAQQK